METLRTLDSSRTMYRVTYSIEFWTEGYDYETVDCAVLQDWTGTSGYNDMGPDLREHILWLFNEQELHNNQIYCALNVQVTNSRARDWD